MLEFLFLSLIIFAIVTVQTKNLIRAVIYLGGLSLICSVTYIMLAAPDVALAEAVIGCTLSTILFLVVLRKYRVFNVCFVYPQINIIQENTNVQDDMSYMDNANIIKLVENYCYSKELEPHIIYSNRYEDLITISYQYDIIVHQLGKQFWLYGRKRNYQVINLKAYIKKNISDLEKDGASIEFELL